LEVEVKNHRGEYIECPSEILWDFPYGIISLTVLSGDTKAEVTGVKTGLAEIEASCEGGSGKANITVLGEIDLSGVWSGTEVANEEDCGEGINTYTATVTISHTDDSSIEAQWSSGSFSGTIICDTINVEGDEGEDDGRSLGSGTLTISPNGRTISGTIPWDWNGIDPETGLPDSCSGTSVITLER
jgi:hypothetical protein